MIKEKENDGDENIPSREVILRSVQIDSQFSNILKSKIFEFFESVSHFRIFRLVNSEILEVLSNFLFYYINYRLNFTRTTPGEEYTNIFLQNNKSDKKTLLFILIQSTYLLLLRKL